MAHRSFDLAPTRADPPTFSVAGREFKCLPEPPSGVLTDLVVATSGSVGQQAAGFVSFLTGCMPDVEAEQFLLVIHDKDTIVPLATLADIAGWLIEEYTGRPTTPSSSSSPGSTQPAATSEDGSPSTTSTPTRSDS